MLKYCTLTGVDDKTDFGWIEEQSNKYPFAEWGILLSLTAGDKDERYTSLSFIEKFAEYFDDKNVKTALHICGKAVTSFVHDTDDIRELASYFNRVQLNFNMLKTSSFSIPELDDSIGSFMGFVITQHNENNAAVTELVTAKNHNVLFDVSGGRGIEVVTWPDRLNTKFYGYAGGFGPDSISENLSSVSAHAAGHPYWIDMETKLREDGYLSPSKCETVLNAVLHSKLVEL